MISFEDKLNTLLKEISFLGDNKDFLKSILSYLEVPIEKESASALRSQIAEAYEYMPFLVRLISRAEALYRIAQGEFVGLAALKGTGREHEINGRTAHYRYARDYLSGLLDTLNSKLSASKSILLSLDNELRNRGD